MYMNASLLFDWKNTVNVSDVTVYSIFTSDSESLFKCKILIPISLSKLR